MIDMEDARWILSPSFVPYEGCGSDLVFCVRGCIAARSGASGAEEVARDIGAGFEQGILDLGFRCWLHPHVVFIKVFAFHCGCVNGRGCPEEVGK